MIVLSVGVWQQNFGALKALSLFETEAAYVG